MCVCIYASNDRYCFPDWTPKAWDKSVRKSSSRSNIYTYVYVSIHIYTYVYMYLRFQRPFMFTQTHTHTHTHRLHYTTRTSQAGVSYLPYPTRMMNWRGIDLLKAISGQTYIQSEHFSRGYAVVHVLYGLCLYVVGTVFA